MTHDEIRNLMDGATALVVITDKGFVMEGQWAGVQRALALALEDTRFATEMAGALTLLNVGMEDKDEQLDSGNDGRAT